MTSVAITSWLVAVSAVLALIIPLVIRRRVAKHRAQAALDAAASAREVAKEKITEANREADRQNFITINAAIQKRETELDRQLAESTREHNQEIRVLKADHLKEMSELRGRVKELEKEVALLRGLVRSRDTP